MLSRRRKKSLAPLSSFQREGVFSWNYITLAVCLCRLKTCSCCVIVIIATVRSLDCIPALLDWRQVHPLHMAVEDCSKHLVSQAASCWQKTSLQHCLAGSIQKSQKHDSRHMLDQCRPFYGVVKGFGIPIILQTSGRTVKIPPPRSYSLQEGRSTTLKRWCAAGWLVLTSQDDASCFQKNSRSTTVTPKMNHCRDKGGVGGDPAQIQAPALVSLAEWEKYDLPWKSFHSAS